MAGTHFTTQMHPSLPQPSYAIVQPVLIHVMYNISLQGEVDPPVVEHLPVAALDVVEAADEVGVDRRLYLDLAL